MFSSEEKNENRPMSDKEAGAFGLVAILGGGWFLIQKNMSKIEWWYFEHFEEIYLGAYALIVLIMMYLIFLVKKKTKEMSIRSNLLYPYWSKNYSNIKIADTPDRIDLYLDDKTRCSHVQVIGTTGAGKTASIVTPWTIRDLKRYRSVIIIDGKGSRDLPFDISNAIDELGIKVEKFHFDLISPETSVSINPLMHGSSQQITDRIFSSFEFSDPFYESVQYDICGYLVKLIHKTNRVVTFKRLYSLLTDDRELSRLLSELDDKDALKAILRGYLKESSKDRKNKMSGLISQLSPFATSEIASIVNSEDDEASIYKLMTYPNKTRVFIFSIPTLKYQKIGTKLGKLILQELAYCVSEKERIGETEFTSVFLDEFSEFVYEGFISILNKARSSNTALHLCHQALSDLTNVSESFARSVNTNTNVKCILGLNDPDTADFYARHFGTKTTEKFTEQTIEQGFFRSKEETGRASMREVESYKIHPNELKELYQGSGVIHFPTKNGTVTERVKFCALNSKDMEV